MSGDGTVECWGDALWGGLCDSALGLENIAAVYSTGSAFVESLPQPAELQLNVKSERRQWSQIFCFPFDAPRICTDGPSKTRVDALFGLV